MILLDCIQIWLVICCNHCGGFLSKLVGFFLLSITMGIPFVIGGASQQCQESPTMWWHCGDIFLRCGDIPTVSEHPHNVFNNSRKVPQCSFREYGRPDVRTGGWTSAWANGHPHGRTSERAPRCPDGRMDIRMGEWTSARADIRAGVPTRTTLWGYNFSLVISWLMGLALDACRQQHCGSFMDAGTKLHCGLLQLHCGGFLDASTKLHCGCFWTRVQSYTVDLSGHECN